MPSLTKLRLSSNFRCYQIHHRQIGHTLLCYLCLTLMFRRLKNDLTSSPFKTKFTTSKWFKSTKKGRKSFSFIWNSISESISETKAPFTLAKIVAENAWKSHCRSSFHRWESCKTFQIRLNVKGTPSETVQFDSLMELKIRILSCRRSLQISKKYCLKALVATKIVSFKTPTFHY